MSGKIFAVRFFGVGLALLALSGCSVVTEMMPVDPQSATLTALVTPTSVQPTLDLKGNDVVGEQGCVIYAAPSITTFDDADDGGIFQWAEGQHRLAYVTPENRYWAWFSGDAAVLTIAEDPDDLSVVFTNGLKVFGDFAFSPNGSRVAFVVFRPSDKLYTVYVASVGSGLQLTSDLFPGNSASTDDYSSQKSVIGWTSENQVRVSTSCGIDCEKVYRINSDTGALVFEEETRKHGHFGRVFEPLVRTLDVRYYPEMSYSNWSRSENLVFYIDERDAVWILDDRTKQQYQLGIEGDGILQSAWSYDAKYLAIRYAEEILVYQVKCK